MGRSALFPKSEVSTSRTINDLRICSMILFPSTRQSEYLLSILPRDSAEIDSSALASEAGIEPPRRRIRRKHRHAREETDRPDRGRPHSDAIDAEAARRRRGALPGARRVHQPDLGRYG